MGGWLAMVILMNASLGRAATSSGGRIASLQ
jgi:hypothetical protein